MAGAGPKGDWQLSGGKPDKPPSIQAAVGWRLSVRRCLNVRCPESSAIGYIVRPRSVHRVVQVTTDWSFSATKNRRTDNHTGRTFQGYDATPDRMPVIDLRKAVRSYC